MQRTLLSFASLLAMGILALPAQQASNDANPLYRPPSIHIGGISIPPIAAAPFSATALVDLQQLMPDGTVSVTHTVNLIGRDSRGRTHGELRPWMPEAFQGMPPLSHVLIVDPQTMQRIDYQPATHIATVQKMSSLPTESLPFGISGAMLTVENLGPATIDHIDVVGTRRTLTIPAKWSGTGAELKVVDDYWYSQDLHVNLVLRHQDPRVGVESIALTDIKREDPDISFFQIPQDYRVVDLTPAENSPAAKQHAMH